MFKYTNKWAEEIYELTLKKPILDNEQDYLLKSYQKANYTKDIRAVAALIKCLEVQVEGREETIHGTLSTVEYSLYYQAVFQYAPSLFNSSNPEAAIYLLDWTRRNLTKPELMEVVSMSEKYLNKKYLQKYIEEMDEYSYEYQEEEPYCSFYNNFKARLKK